MWPSAGPPSSVLVHQPESAEGQLTTAMVESGQSATVSVFENTTLGMSFIGLAYSSLEVGQKPAVSSQVVLG
jgi:hypothetical protein